MAEGEIMARVFRIWLARSLAMVPVWLVLLVLPTASLKAETAAGAETCKSGREMIAEVAADFLLFQQAAAGFCDTNYTETKLKEAGPMGILMLKIQHRFRAEFLELIAVRGGYFKRAHGENWKRELANANAMVAWRLSTLLRFNEAQCTDFRQKMETRLDLPWSAIEKKLEETAKKNSGGAKLCN